MANKSDSSVSQLDDFTLGPPTSSNSSYAQQYASLMRRLDQYLEKHPIPAAVTKPVRYSLGDLAKIKKAPRIKWQDLDAPSVYNVNYGWSWSDEEKGPEPAVNELGEVSP